MSLHERMMQSHGANGNGAPKDIVSFNITLKSKRQIAEGTYEFIFDKPADFYAYKAGQHGRMTLIDPPETDAEGNARFLSFASTPDEPELRFAMRMRDTAFKRVLGNMKPGEQVLFQMRQKNMHGSFALQDAADAGRPAVFLIGGIGIVPVYSMIKDALAHSVRHKITLFYSNRRPEDAPYLSDLQKLAKANPSVFELVTTVTEPEKSAQKWSGETGFITKEMIQRYVSDMSAPLYYIAGLTEMVAAMQKVLADAGIKKDSIRAEEFGAFTTAHAAEQQGGQQNTGNKNHLLMAAVVVFILLMIAGHFWGASHVHLGELSWRNPLAYVAAAVIVGIIAFKIFVGLRLKNAYHAKQSGESLTMKDMMQAHKPTKKS